MFNEIQKDFPELKPVSLNEYKSTKSNKIRSDWNRDFHEGEMIMFVFPELKNNLDDRVLSIGYSLVLAGLLGNFLDRLIDGYIIDYLSFKILGYNYPIFNFADILIVVGIVIVIIKEILKERGKKNEVRSK